MFFSRVYNINQWMDHLIAELIVGRPLVDAFSSRREQFIENSTDVSKVPHLSQQHFQVFFFHTLQSTTYNPATSCNYDMRISINGGTPKSSIYKWMVHEINHPWIGDTHIYGPRIDADGLTGRDFAWSWRRTSFPCGRRAICHLSGATARISVTFQLPFIVWLRSKASM